MKLFQFAQMFPIAPKFERRCLNYPNWFKLLENVSNCSLCKFKWSTCILPKMECISLAYYLCL